MAQNSWSSGRPASTQQTPARRRTDQPPAHRPDDGDRSRPARSRRRAGPASLLAKAATALLGCADASEVARVVLAAAEELAERHGGGEGVVWLSGPESLEPAALSEGLTVVEVRTNDLPRRLVGALDSAGWARVDGAAVGVSRRGGGHLEMDLVPLPPRGASRGLLGIARRRPCARGGSCGCWEALDGLAASAALALGSPASVGGGSSAERLSSLVENADDVVAIVARDGSIEYVNEAASRMLGYPTSMLRQLGLPGILDGGDVAAWRALHEAVTTAGSQTMRCRLLHADRSLRHAELRATNLLESGVAGIAVVLRDMTASALTQAVLQHRASHDPLTDLPNRALLLQRVQEAVSDPDRRNRLAVLSLDLDGFAAVNERLGHAGGDLLLIVVAERLRDFLTAATCIARTSGDEFAVLLEGLSPADLSRQAESVANRLLVALRRPGIVLDESVSIGASVGVAVGVDGLEDAGDLLHRADLAMYTAKAEGGGRSSASNPVDQHTSFTKQLLRSELPRAFDRNELEVRYQPIVSLADGSVVSTEALVRWHHPRRGLLGPATFIPLAEDEGLVDEVFDFVLLRACHEVRRWQERLGLAAPGVAVNLSPRQLGDGLVERIAAALSAARIPPSCLTLELTENVLLADPHAAGIAMGALKDLGVRLAIDDFGTGYSSLAYLRALPVDALKVDKAFVHGLGSRDPSGLLARTIVDLGHRLGLKTVAEGIERPEQLELLRQIGCDHGQGYLFARPLLGAGVADLVRSRLRNDLGVG